MPITKSPTGQPIFTYQTFTNPSSGIQVNYREQGTPNDSPSNEAFSRTEGSAVRQFYTPWKTRWSFVQNMLGYSFVANSGTAKWISRVVPMSYVDFSSGHDPTDGVNTQNAGDYLWADSIMGMKPFFPYGVPNALTKVATFQEALYTLGWRSYPYDILTDAQIIAKQQPFTAFPYPKSVNVPDESTLLRYCYTHFVPTNKYQTIPPFSTLVWGQDAGSDAGKPASAVVPIILPEGDYTVYWMQVPIEGLNWAAIKSTVGKTNVANFGRLDFPGGLMAAGTLVCLNPELSIPYRMNNGRLAYDVKFKFKYYPYGANNFFKATGNPKTGLMGYISVNYPTTPPTPLFQSVDYTLMFTPP
jgi:hypothetical protein